jgi:hypothetical protein
MEYGVLIYRGTRNLGDAIQTYALTRLLPGELQGCFRDARDFPKEGQLVINGWIGSSLRLRRQSAIFAGIHINFRWCKSLGWLNRSRGRIGARDPYTQRELEARGFSSDDIGCVTLTLSPYSGPRRGKYWIDGPKVANCIPLSNALSHRITWIGQWQAAAELLEKLKQAEIVYTNRLHIALPCLAFGTPVVVEKSMANDPRFSIWDSLGLSYGEPVTKDLTAQRARYLDWLSSSLGINVEPRTARMPVEKILPKKPYKRIVIGIMSAQKFADRRKRCLETWAVSTAEAETVFFVGDPTLQEPVLEGDLLRLPCPDDFKSLPQKIRMFCSWALENRDFQYLFKCDDDTYVSMKRLLQHSWQGDYIGRGRSRVYAFGGPGYFLSARAADIVAQNLLKENGREDVSVGRLLRKHGISLIQCHALGRPPRYGELPTLENDLITSHPVRDRLMYQISDGLDNRNIED